MRERSTAALVHYNPTAAAVKPGRKGWSHNRTLGSAGVARHAAASTGVAVACHRTLACLILPQIFRKTVISTNWVYKAWNLSRDSGFRIYVWTHKLWAIMMKREMFFEDRTKLKTEIIEERIFAHNWFTILVIGIVFIFLGMKYEFLFCLSYKKRKWQNVHSIYLPFTNLFY